MTDLDDPKRRMFGDYQLKPNSGVNPPYSPAYPVEWGCTLRTVEIMTRVAPGKVASLLADTPFEIASERVAFRFMLSPGHSLAVHAGQMFDLMITVPVRYKGLFTETHIFMYCSDPMGICAGREVFGYTKKDAHYAFDERAGRCDLPDGSSAAAFRWRISASRRIRRRRSSALSMATSSPAAKSMCAACRIRSAWRGLCRHRLPPHAAEIFRAEPGRATMTLHACDYDPIADLEPEILGAQFMVSDVYGGGFEVEDRRLIERLIP